MLKTLFTEANQGTRLHWSIGRDSAVTVGGAMRNGTPLSAVKCAILTIRPSDPWGVYHAVAAVITEGGAHVIDPNIWGAPQWVKATRLGEVMQAVGAKEAVVLAPRSGGESANRLLGDAMIRLEVNFPPCLKSWGQHDDSIRFGAPLFRVGERTFVHALPPRGSPRIQEVERRSLPLSGKTPCEGGWGPTPGLCTSL